MQSNITYRDNSLDALCGLFIIEMIFRHAMEWSNAWDDQLYVNIKNGLYCMMPWFFFKSGMFYKNKLSLYNSFIEDKFSRRKQLINLLSYDAMKLLLPFVVYTVIGVILSDYRFYLENNEIVWRSFIYEPMRGLIIDGSTGGNLPLWFLLSLFLVKATMYLSEYLNISKKYLFVLSMIFALGGAYLTQRNHFPIWTLSTAEGLIFYIMGYWLRNCQYSHLGIKVICLFFVIFSFAVFPSEVDIHFDTINQGFWLPYQVYSIAMIVILNNIFRLKMFQLPMFSSIGRDSMTYYCYHWLLFQIIAIVCDFPQNGIPNYREFWTLSISSIIILPIVAYWRKLIKGLVKQRIIK